MVGSNLQGLCRKRVRVRAAGVMERCLGLWLAGGHAQRAVFVSLLLQCAVDVLGRLLLACFPSDSLA